MRRVVLVAAIVGAWWWWWHHRDREAPSLRAEQSQAAVLGDGFAARRSDQVIELDRDGRRRATHRVPDDRPLRVFGTTAGVAASWIKNGQLQLFDVKNNEVVGAWGTAAKHLCDGVATNDARFAVAWTEDDGGLWWLHGPTSAHVLGASNATRIATTSETRFCAIASAEDRIALIWRDRNRLLINWCSAAKCSPLPASVKLAPDVPILAAGCLRNACVIATRDSNNIDELMYVTESGAVKWRDQPIVPDTSPDTVRIVGIADSAFAVAMSSTVMRYDRGGKRTELWSGSEFGTPAIAWSRGKLLVVHGKGETIVEVPR